MRTLKEARAFHTSSNQSDTQSYFKHLGDMNYQIMIVDHSHHKTFFGEPFRKDTISDSAINQVLKGKAYHGIKNKPFELFITGFLIMKRIILWVSLLTKIIKSLPYLCVLI